MRQTSLGGWTAVLVDQEWRWLDIVEGVVGQGDADVVGTTVSGFAASAVACPLRQTDASVTMAIPPTEQDVRQATMNVGQPARRVRPLSSRR
jgi:hypothetical protein